MARFITLLLLVSFKAFSQTPSVAVDGYDAVITYPDGKHYSTSRDEAAGIFYQLAVYNYNQGKLDEALSSDNLAYFCDSKNSLVVFMRGMIEMRTNKLDSAIDDFTLTISLNKAYAPAYAKRASCQGMKANYAGAAEDFKKALELDANDPQTNYQLGQTLVMLNKKEEAKQYLQFALKKGIKSAQSWLDRCETGGK